MLNFEAYIEMKALDYHHEPAYSSGLIGSTFIIIAILLQKRYHTTLIRQPFRVPYLSDEVNCYIQRKVTKFCCLMTRNCQVIFQEFKTQQ